MLRKCINSRRHTGRYLSELMVQLGPAVLMMIEEILDIEVKTLVNDQRVFLPPSRLSPAMGRSFTFDNITSAYSERAPFTWELVRVLSGVNIPDQDTVADDELHIHQRESGNEDEDGGANVGALGSGRRGLPVVKVNVRDKVLMASCAMAVMLNSRTERLNHFQNMVSASDIIPIG